VVILIPPIFSRSTHINGFNKCIYNHFRYLNVAYCYNLLHVSAVSEIQNRRIKLLHILSLKTVVFAYKKQQHAKHMK